MSKNTIKTYVLLAGLGFFLVFIGQLLGGSSGATLGLLLGLVILRRVVLVLRQARHPRRARGAR